LLLVKAIIMDNQPNVTSSQSGPASLYDLMRLVLLDSNLDVEQKTKLIDELRKNNPTTSDRWTFRWAIWILGAAVLLSIVFIFILGRSDNPKIPESLIALGSTVAGGLVGVLAPTQRTASSKL
jgi:uncharacterized integral membrane protein